MEILNTLISNIEKLIAIIAFFAAIVFALLHSFSGGKRDYHLKLSGSLIVAVFAFLANNVGIYALASFIVATIITKLDFLENLAAIFWGRKEFWGYRIQLAKANKNQLEGKLEQDIRQEIKEDDSGKTLADFRRSALQFEGNMLRSLDKVFNTKRIMLAVRIEVRGLTYVIDAVAMPSKEDVPAFYVIEFKYASSSKNVNLWAKQLLGYLSAYQEFVEDKEPGVAVRGLLIIPSEIYDKDFIGRDIGVLKYDLKNHRFLNLDAISAWISGEYSLYTGHERDGNVKEIADVARFKSSDG